MVYIVLIEQKNARQGRRRWLTSVYTNRYTGKQMDVTTVSGFDWDEGNLAKCVKHGVTIGEIEAVFHHPHRLAPDIAHSETETRFLAIGRGQGPRPIFVAFTLREIGEESFIRPISARYMHQKEIDRYDQATATPDQ